MLKESGADYWSWTQLSSCPPALGAVGIEAPDQVARNVCSGTFVAKHGRIATSVDGANSNVRKHIPPRQANAVGLPQGL